MEADMISFTKEKRILNVVMKDSLLIETAQKVHQQLF